METNRLLDAFRLSPSIYFSQNGRYLSYASDKGGYVYDIEGSHDQAKLILAPGTDMAGEGCGLVSTEMPSAWISTGNDTTPENSSRLVRVCDVTGTILGYRVTTTPILAIRMFKPETWSDDKALIVIVTQLNIFVYDSALEQCKLIIDTESNPHGAIAVSAQEPLRMAYPCPSIKGVKVATFGGEDVTVFQGTFSSPLQILSFSPSGRHLAATDQDGLNVYAVTFPDSVLVASASGHGGAVVNGSLFINGSKSTPTVRSYRRGTQKCRMTSLSFNPKDEDVLCCASDHGTVHVFNINPSLSLLSMSGTVLWNFQIKDTESSPPYPKSSQTASAHTSWCHFSSDGSHLYRVMDGRVAVYNIDFNPQRPGATLLIVKDLSARKLL